MQAEKRPQYVAVVCSLCGTRMHARAERIGETINCPDCGRPATIKPPPPVRGEPVHSDPGEYGVAGQGGGGGKPAAPADVPRVLHICPVCGTRMNPRAEHVGRRVICPDCRTPNPIRAVEEIKRRSAPDLVAGEYDMGQAPAAKPTVPMHYALPDAIEKRIDVDPPPHWTFFSNVFSFPWQSGTVLRWVGLTAGLLVAGELIVLVLAIFELSGDTRSTVLAGACIGILFFWVTLWSVSFAVSCMTIIIQETAEGANRIHEWPTSDWRDWVFNLVALIQVIFILCAVGYVLAWLVRLAAPPSWTAEIAGAFVAFLLLPILWLSALESGSAVTPYSPPILRSLVKLTWAWLLFNLLAAATAALPLAIVGLGKVAPSWLVALGFAPTAAAATFIYARLLGRLGWLITEQLPPVDDEEDAETA